MVYSLNFALNLHKMNIIKCITSNSAQYAINIVYKEKYMDESVNKKFIDLQIDKHPNWGIIRIKYFIDYVEHVL